MSTKKEMTMGLIVGNRGFFPGHLAESGRKEMIQVLQEACMDVVSLTPEQSRYGAVETHEEAKRCAELFRAHAEKIDGVIVTLPNFGDERAIADTLRLSSLRVPVLVQATPDTPSKMSISFRRDSFCGKMSACNNLTQYGIPYSLTSLAYRQRPDPRNSRKTWNGLQGLPRRERPAESAHRQHWRSPHGIQYGSLQRKDSRIARNFGRDARSL